MELDTARRQGIAKKLPTNRDARRADRKRRREDSESDEELRDPLPGKSARLDARHGSLRPQKQTPALTICPANGQVVSSQLSFCIQSVAPASNTRSETPSELGIM